MGKSSTSDRRPGANGGGWLKSGNTKNVGRKPEEVRTDMLKTVDEATAVMRSILDGEFKQPVRDMFGKVVGERPATIQEFVKVFDALAKHALPAKTQLSGPGDGPIPLSVGPDLSGLSVEERERLLAILEKAEAAQPE